MDGRSVAQPHDDPVEHARVNALLVLFGHEEAAAFTTLLARMPPERRDAWVELLSGGASSEAFGPLTLQEQLDERQVEQAMTQGRRQRRINLAVGFAVFAVVAAALTVAWQTFATTDPRTQGAFQFDPLDETVGAPVAGGQPLAVAELTAALDTPIAVSAGTGPRVERIVTAPFSAFPQPPGALRASVFAFDGRGQLAVVGPDGWLDQPICLRASVTTKSLRPLDTVSFETDPTACVDAIGRSATVTCLGSSAVVFGLDIPVGEVPLPEGGSGFADLVRVQLLGSDEGYETLSVRGEIAVAPDAQVTIPSFGGSLGDEVIFDLGADRVGACTLTDPGA